MADPSSTRPPSDARVALPASDPDADLDAGVGTSKVLVVDDDPRNILAVEAALHGLDLQLVTALTADHALGAVLDHDPTLLLLDLRLPDADGFEVARLIRERPSTRHLPIIFLSAFGDSDHDMERCYELGGVDYIRKPFVPAVLRAKVQAFVDLHEREMRLRLRDRQLRALERDAAERKLEEARHEWETSALRREMEGERAQKAELEKADRRKDEFLAVLGHELRNPLAPLVTGLELVRAETRGLSRVEQACEAMGRQLEHLVRLVDDLLDVARISSGKVELRREAVDVRTCIDRALEMFAPALQRAGHRLQLALGDEPLLCDADGMRLTQVVGNLLSNAIRYTPPGGEISISAGAEGPDVVVFVRDNGIGIGEEMLERIFDTFVQARVGAGGLGLGLTLVEQVVAIHGGRVQARSAGEGRGSEFEVRLPRLHDAPGDASAEPGFSVDARIDPLRVLVVDDNPDVRELERELIASWGHDVLTAEDGTTAIAAVTASRPDVVLLDLALPDLDGYEVAARIRGQLGEGCPLLVALTGFGRAEDHARSRQAGFDAHIIKPARPDTLREVLRRARRTRRAIGPRAPD